MERDQSDHFARERVEEDDEMARGLNQKQFQVADGLRGQAGRNRKDLRGSVLLERSHALGSCQHAGKLAVLHHRKLIVGVRFKKLFELGPLHRIGEYGLKVRDG